MNQNVNTLLSEEETETDDVLSALERTEAERTYCTKLGVVAGGLIGWVIGVTQLFAIGSWDFFYWAYMPLIVLYTVLGWALFGMIIGGSGLFSKKIAHESSESAYRHTTHAA